MAELSPDTSLSHYRIVSRISAGSMGEVYLAQDTKLDRKVALKTLPADLAANRDHPEALATRHGARHCRLHVAGTSAGKNKGYRSTFRHFFIRLHSVRGSNRSQSFCGRRRDRHAEQDHSLVAALDCRLTARCFKPSAKNCASMSG